MRGKFYESEYEEALIDLLQDEGWQYTNGGNIHRQLREPLLVEDPNVNDLHVYCRIVIPTSPAAMSMRWSTICATFLDKPTLNVCATHSGLSVTAIAIPVMAME